MTTNSVRDLGPAKADTWDDWVVRILFSADPAKAAVDVWRNGTQVVANFKPTVGTLYPSLSSYWKVGYYRSDQISVASTVYLDNLSIA